jgi:uncharacterized protein YegL
LPGKYHILLLFFVLTAFHQDEKKKNRPEHKIQIALLLDVSGSMHGLISQAKGQFWRMVNELAKAKKNGQSPVIEIAIGTFGHFESVHSGFFKLHTPLTADIDLAAENLFHVAIEGQDEYCGHAIQCSLDSLQWSSSKDDLKIIFIAGNEPFDQGPTDYSKACKSAVKKNVIVNTVYCGKEEDGIKFLWEQGAKAAKGKFTFISLDSAIKYGETFWDKKITDLNDRFNSTYVPYGPDGEKHLTRQLKQDGNAILLGSSFMRDRVIFKASDMYNNAKWDLADAYKSDSSILRRLEPGHLPCNMREMTIEKKKEYLEKKTKERSVYKESIQLYYDKAQEELKAASVAGSTTLTLDSRIITILKEQAKKKRYAFE